MKKNPILWGAVLLCGMALSGCQQPEPSGQPQELPVPTVLTVSITQPTRTEIVAGENPHPIYWENDDLIVVHFDTDPEATEMHYYALTSGAGTTEGTFEWQNWDDTLPATYNSLVAGYSAMYVSFTENAELVLEAHSEIFMGLENVSDFPMHGSANAGDPLAFHCGFGLVHVAVTGNVTISRLAIDTAPQSGQEIAGQFKIALDTYETTFLQPGPASTNQYEIVWSGKQNVTLSDTPVDFYGVMPDGTYNAGTTFTFTLSDGSTIVKTTQQPFTVSRAQILNLPPLDIVQ